MATRLSMKTPAAAATHPVARARRVVAAGLVAIAVLAILSTVVLGWVHVDDRYRVDHVGGARIALAQYTLEGVLYPPLQDGGFYGGTRFMPLPIVLHAGLAGITGEYLVSGKLVAYVTMAALVLVSFLLLRRMGCPPALATGLATMVLLTQTGIGAAMGLRADALPVLLQVLAVGAVIMSSRPRATAVAGVLAGLAFAAKLSAIWAPMAIGLWFLARDRRRLIWFVAAYAVSVAALVGLFAALSEGRMLESVFGLAGAGLGEGRLLTAPYRLFLFAVEDATPAWFLLPVVGVAAWYALRDRRVELWLLSLVCAVAVLVVVLADIGTGWNQLIDLVVLVALAVGAFAGRTLPVLPEGRVIAVGLSVAVLWVNATAWTSDVLPELRTAASVAMSDGATAPSAVPLQGLATAETVLLSEDPYVPVSLGQRPVVLDAFMLRQLARADPDAVAPLVERIETREFELVVLLLRVDDEANDDWWQHYHFGPEVAAALRHNYSYRETRGPYHIYEPALSVDGSS